jgi:hypothetical protein
MAAEGAALVQAGLDPHGGEGALMARQVGRRSCEAKAAVGRDELRGDAVQPGTTSSLHPCGARGKSNAARVRHVAQDRQRW